jgi:hypothetical protein
MRRLDRVWLALLLALLFGSYPAGAQDTMELAKKEGKVVGILPLRYPFPSSAMRLMQVRRASSACSIATDRNVYTSCSRKPRPDP